MLPPFSLGRRWIGGMEKRDKWGYEERGGGEYDFKLGGEMFKNKMGSPMLSYLVATLLQLGINHGRITGVRIYWKWSTLKYCLTLDVFSYISGRFLKISFWNCVSSLLYKSIRFSQSPGPLIQLKNRYRLWAFKGLFLGKQKVKIWVEIINV